MIAQHTRWDCARHLCASLLLASVWFETAHADDQSGGTQAARLFAAFPEIPAGQARIFFFRESHFVGNLSSARLKVERSTVGWLNNGAAVFVDYPAGDVGISIDSPGQFGHDGFNITLVAGQQYFVPVAAQANSMFTGGAAGHFLGSLKADIHQYCGGGWCAAIVDQESALPVLSNIPVSAADPNASHGLF